MFLMVTLMIGVTGRSPVILRERLDSAINGEPYEVWLSGQGGVGEYEWILSDPEKLPKGLHLSPNGYLSGIPKVTDFTEDEKMYEFEVTLKALRIKVENPQDARTFRRYIMTVKRDKPLLLSELPPVKIITESPFPDAITEKAYNVALSVQGGLPPYSWTSTEELSSYNLTLDQKTGIISGSPQKTTEKAAEFTFTVLDSRPTGTPGIQDTKILKLKILKPLPEETPVAKLEILIQKLPSTFIGKEFEAPIAVCGGIPPFKFSISEQPAGIHITDRGIIQESSEKAGSFRFKVTVTDSSSPVQKNTGEVLLSVLSPIEVLTSSKLLYPRNNLQS